MDTQPSQTETSSPFHHFKGDFSQGSHPSLIYDYESCSKEDYLHQLKEPLLGQPIQSSSAVDPKILLEKVKEIDRRLEKGWFFAYKLWLYFVTVAAPWQSLFLAGYVVELWEEGRAEHQSWTTAMSIFLIFVLYYMNWSVRQALLHKQALRQKDAKMAGQAFSSLQRLAIYYLCLCFVFSSMVILFAYYYLEEKEFKRDLFDALCKLFFIFIANYFVPVGISIYGSKQVKDLLEEKQMLILEANSDDDDDNAEADSDDGADSSESKV